MSMHTHSIQNPDVLNLNFPTEFPSQTTLPMLTVKRYINPMKSVQRMPQLCRVHHWFPAAHLGEGHNARRCHSSQSLPPLRSQLPRRMSRIAILCTSCAGNWDTPHSSQSPSAFTYACTRNTQDVDEHDVRRQW